MPLARARAGFLDIVRLMAPRPGRLELATRLAVICALTVLVVEIYQTPDAALTVYVVFFLNRGDRAVSLILNLVLVALITVIIGFVLLIAMVVINDPMWRVISMTAISIAILFVASASKLRPLGGTIALIVAYALDLLGTMPLAIGEVATRSLLYAWLFVGIPAGVSMIVNLLLAPAPRRLAEQGIAHGLELSAAMLKAPNENIRSRFREHLREGTAEVLKLLGLADREKTSKPDDIAALRQAADSTTLLMSAIDVMDRWPEAQLSIPLADYLARTLREMSRILGAGGYPIRIDWNPPDMERALTPLEADVLGDIKEAIIHFAEAPSSEHRLKESKEEGGGFFVADAFTNPDYIQYALKTTAAAMFCYFLYSLLDWPGIHTSFLTCYIVSLGTTAETVEKLTLRILGCLVGAAAGYGTMIFIIPYLTSITALMVVVFAGALAAGYVSAGSERISYAGFQFAFAFFLCVIQGPSPAFDLSTARDRVIGILLGNVVTYLLFTNLWPISVGKRIDPAIAALLRRLAAVMTADKSVRRALASQAQSELAEVETDIDLAAYEPSTIRPNAQWLAARRKAADEIGALGSPLLLSADKHATSSAQIAKRLEALAGRFAVAETPPPLQRPTQWNTSPLFWNRSPLFPMIDAGLRRLEDASV
jgi:multidrug resistance protein MdtO